MFIKNKIVSYELYSYDTGITQPSFTCSKIAIETSEECVKSVET